MSRESNVTVVNHGRVFNNDKWFTFYCPKCKGQIIKLDSEYKCEHCNHTLKWPKS